MENNSELGKRIKMRRLELGMKQNDFEDVGISQASISKLERGEYKKTPQIADLAKALQTTTEWLMFGGEIISIPKKESDSDMSKLEDAIGIDPWDNNTPLQPYEVELPFLKDIQLAAGDGCFELIDYEGRKLRFSKKTLKDNGVDPSQAICVTAKGESMEPVIPDKCTVAVDLGDKEISDGQIYAINNDGLFQIKILKWVTGAEISIESYNPSYPPFHRKLSDIEVIGRIFWYSVLLKK